ncbi:hypothetical protein [Vibrio owensii]|uniref:hypothetical protein n=1 Tax=Vibrio harveyi group TaxID=717610 RepID=UPI003CC5C96E
MMNKLLVAIVAITSIGLTGCMDARPEKVSSELASKIVDNISYIKDRKGICYSVVQVGSYGNNASGIGMAVVDCKLVGL